MDPSEDSSSKVQKSHLTVAVVGCTHGALDLIYQMIRNEEKTKKIHVDLLLCCGDFECARNDQDLATVEGPVKTRGHKDFYKYYNGEKVAPVLTLFIGGNHESVNHLDELSFGGWVAPNIYFLGASGVVQFGGLRIGGFSGTFQQETFKKGRFEKMPYEGDTKITAFHVREFELWKLLHLTGKVDIMMSHDWPNNVISHGNSEELFQQRPSFQGQDLGAKPYTALMKHLKPSWWLSGHMHVKFEATIPHLKKDKSIDSTTYFLALDKAMPERSFIDFKTFEMAPGATKVLQYDLEWLSIQALSYGIQTDRDEVITLPTRLSQENLNGKQTWLKEHGLSELLIPYNFVQTSPPHYMHKKSHHAPFVPPKGPTQTQLFKKLIGIDPSKN